MTRRLVIAALALSPLLAGCAGQPCEDLPRLLAERDAARQDYAELVVDGTAPPEVTGPADDALHAVERRVYDLEQDWQGR